MSVVAAAHTLVAAPPALAGEALLRVGVDSVIDSRARTSSNETSGRLTIVPKLEGPGLEAGNGVRIRVTAAKDDTGKSLLPDEPEPPVAEGSATGPVPRITLASPVRGAATVTVSGRVELFASPGDPGAMARTRRGRTLATVAFELKEIPLP
jgi:hypothetical protein